MPLKKLEDLKKTSDFKSLKNKALELFFLSFLNKFLISQERRLINELTFGFDALRKMRVIFSQLEEKNKTLERFNELTIGRELQMIKLKEQIKELKAQKDA